MVSKWDALTAFLRSQGDSVTLTWRELEDMVGGMPASSVDHMAWWVGDRPHIRAWKEAGFDLVGRTPGISVKFRRTSLPSEQPSSPRPPSEISETAPFRGSEGPATRIVLIACAKAKRDRPAAASDLYVSPRFRKARSYADGTGDPWFILSGEHGLVAPDEWLAPYERYLPETSREHRAAWGQWVVARLELLMGSLATVSVEIHAGDGYVTPIQHELERRGALVERPLAGLTSGRWQGWYDQKAGAATPPNVPAYDRSAYTEDPFEWLEKLGNVDNSLTADELATLERLQLDGPGLYSWFVDSDGADVLSRGLNAEVRPGLIYVGQTGATRWPSGLPSSSTLVKRIGSQHLRGRRSASTLRRTLGAALDAAFDRTVNRIELSDWMSAHLRVVPAVADDADSLGDLERQVVQNLEPPLNLDHVGLTPVRVSLKRLRSASDDRVLD